MSKKYHIVRSKDLRKVSELLIPCPIAHRPKGEGAVRQFPQVHEFVTNFQGSASYRTDKYTIDWDAAPCGTIVGTIRGLGI